MKPIIFEVKKAISSPPEKICEKVLDVANWSDFDGYGILPGIEKAEFEKRTKAIDGSRIRVTNSDGSEHIEDIIEWDLGKRLGMKMHEFPTTLSYIATHFIEDWNFEESSDNETLIIRKFELYPTSFLTRPVLRQISSLLRKGVEKHLDQIAKEHQTD